MAWLLNEDRAIKTKLQGLKVTDTNAPATGRDVAVRFVTPETEMADLTFPIILIRYAGISRASEREHRGPTTLPYIPEHLPRTPVTGRNPETGEVITWDPSVDYDPTYSPFKVQEHPIPYNVDYQIEIWARYNSHLIDIARQLANVTRIPERFGYLEVPEDGTVRTLELLGGPVTLSAARDNDQKRIFRAGYSVRVASELDVYAVEQITKWVDQVDVNLYQWTAEIPTAEG